MDNGSESRHGRGTLRPSAIMAIVAIMAKVAAVFLGLVFLFAAYAKGIDPASFGEQITAEGLDFLLPAGAVAWIAVVLEAVLGLALVLGVRNRWVLVPTGLLIVFFVFLTGRAYWRDLNGIELATPCGCFGNLVDRTPAEAFWQDLAMLVPPFLLTWLWGRTDRTPRWKVAALAVAALAVGLFVWKAPGLPLDDLATRLKPGSNLGDLCAGRAEDGSRACVEILMPELAAGRHLVVMDGFESADLAERIPWLNGLADSADGPGVWLVNTATDEEQMAFFWQWAPSFEAREIPLPLLRPFYRRMPRSFLMEDGVVLSTWPGYPPEDAIASAGPGAV